MYFKDVNFKHKTFLSYIYAHKINFNEEKLNVDN